MAVTDSTLRLISYSNHQTATESISNFSGARQISITFTAAEHHSRNACHNIVLYLRRTKLLNSTVKGEMGEKGRGSEPRSHFELFDADYSVICRQKTGLTWLENSSDFGAWRFHGNLRLNAWSNLIRDWWKCPLRAIKWCVNPLSWARKRVSCVCILCKWHVMSRL